MYLQVKYEKTHHQQALYSKKSSTFAFGKTNNENSYLNKDDITI